MAETRETPQAEADPDVVGPRLDAADFTALRIEEREDRLHARMDRPAVRNAIDATMVDEFHAVCAHLEQNPKILIISGTQVES